MRRLLATTPFIAVIIPLIIGIVVAQYVQTPLLTSSLVTFVGFIITALLIERYRVTAFFYGSFAIFSLGLTLSSALPAPTKQQHSTIEIAAKAQNSALERLSRLNLSEDCFAVSAAMSIGVKDEISRELRKSYSKVGASHILAVSGLHVGMVFLLINALLLLAPLFSAHGHIWKHAVAICLIWCYALIAGASPSIVRAAMMFSFAQIAIAMTRERNALNIILASATIMLCINPHYLYDLSFQLSYAATLAIILFFKPVYSYLKCRSRIGNFFTQLIIITLIASLGTAPLVAYHFGTLPAIGLASNIPVVILAHAIVLLSIVWIIMPFEFLNTLFSNVLEWVISAQNSVVNRISEHPAASYTIELSLTNTLLCYSLLVVAALLISRKKHYLCDDDND